MQFNTQSTSDDPMFFSMGHDYNTSQPTLSLPTSDPISIPNQRKIHHENHMSWPSYLRHMSSQYGNDMTFWPAVGTADIPYPSHGNYPESQTAPGIQYSNSLPDLLGENFDTTVSQASGQALSPRVLQTPNTSSPDSR